MSSASSSEDPKAFYNILLNHKDNRFRDLAPYFEDITSDEVRSLNDNGELDTFSFGKKGLLWKLFVKSEEAVNFFQPGPDFSWEPERPDSLVLNLHGQLSLGGRVVSESLSKVPAVGNSLSVSRLIEMVPLISNFGEITAVYLNNCYILATDCTEFLFPFFETKLPHLRHLNLEFTRIEGGDEKFNQALESLLDRQIKLVLTGTGFASSDNETWFADPKSYTPDRAAHLIWILPSHLHGKVWPRCFEKREDSSQAIEHILNAHLEYYK